MQPIGDLIEQLRIKREELTDLESTKKKLYKAKVDLEIQLMNAMDNENITSMRGDKATVSISEAVVPTVDSWEDFYTYILETKQPYLLERRPAVTAFREILESGNEVPGLKPFTRRTVNFRTR